MYLVSVSWATNGLDDSSNIIADQRPTGSTNINETENALGISSTRGH